MVLPPSLQGSLPAGWLAFTGRELNPLDRNEGFQVTSSSLPGLFLAQRPKTCTEPDRAKLAPQIWRPMNHEDEYYACVIVAKLSQRSRDEFLSSDAAVQLIALQALAAEDAAKDARASR